MRPEQGAAQPSPKPPTRHPGLRAVYEHTWPVGVQIPGGPLGLAVASGFGQRGHPEARVQVCLEGREAGVQRKHRGFLGGR